MVVGNAGGHDYFLIEDRVIAMLLIHDIGEIDAGDTIIYQEEGLMEQKGPKSKQWRGSSGYWLLRKIRHIVKNDGAVAGF